MFVSCSWSSSLNLNYYFHLLVSLLKRERELISVANFHCPVVVVVVGRICRLQANVWFEFTCLSGQIGVINLKSIHIYLSIYLSSIRPNKLSRSCAWPQLKARLTFLVCPNTISSSTNQNQIISLLFSPFTLTKGEKSFLF